MRVCACVRVCVYIYIMCVCVYIYMHSAHVLRNVTSLDAPLPPPFPRRGQVRPDRPTGGSSDRDREETLDDFVEWL